MKHANTWKSAAIIVFLLTAAQLHAQPPTTKAVADASPIGRITLIDKREELKLPEYQLPEHLSICIEAHLNCHYKFYEIAKQSSETGELQAGSFFKGENYITLPAGGFFLEPGTRNHSYILEVKAGDLTIKKNLNLEITVHSGSHSDSDTENRDKKLKGNNNLQNHNNNHNNNQNINQNINQKDAVSGKNGKKKNDLLEPRYYELSMVFGQSIIETVTKAVDPLAALSRITKKEPYRIKFDPAYPVPGSNPSEHAATLSPLTLVGIGYNMIKKKIKAKKERKKRRRLRKKTIIAGTFYTTTLSGGKKPITLSVKLSSTPPGINVPK